MDLVALDAGGLKLAQTVFRIDATLQPGLWRCEWTTDDGERIASKTLIHAHGGVLKLTAENVEIQRHNPLPPGATTLMILVAPDLRDQLKDVIEGIEAEERREREEHQAEAVAQTEDLPPVNRVTFSGIVSLDEHGAPLIKGEPVLPWIERTFAHNLVEVYLGAEREPAITRAGEVEVDRGFHGGEVTPPEPPRIEVGGFDLLSKLSDLEGHHVELVVREITRDSPFYIEVDPRLPEGQWITPHMAFSAKPRASSELTGEKLIQLVEREASHIVVSFSMFRTVQRAIKDYLAIERDQGRVLAAIEVVPAVRDGSLFASGATAVTHSGPISGLAVEAEKIKASDLSGHAVAGLETEGERQAAQRGADAFKAGKYLVVIDRQVADGPWWRKATWASESMDSEIQEAVLWDRDVRDNEIVEVEVIDHHQV